MNYCDNYRYDVKQELDASETVCLYLRVYRLLFTLPRYPLYIPSVTPLTHVYPTTNPQV